MNSVPNALATTALAVASSSLLILTSAVAAATGPASIRAIDFANFTYPLPPEACEPPADCAIPMRAGKHAPPGGARASQRAADWTWAGVDGVAYGDLTGDGGEEALVRLSWTGGGSGQFSTVYVYTLDGETPRVLATLPRGDRGDGGYVDACVRQGQLVAVRWFTTTCPGCGEGTDVVRLTWSHGAFLPEAATKSPAGGGRRSSADYVNPCAAH